MDALHIDSHLDHFAGYGAKAAIHENLLSREWLVPLRCNFWVQLAYGLLIFGPAAPFLHLLVPLDFLLNLPFYAPFVSLFLLLITFGGKDSLLAYQRACQHIEAFDRFDERAQKKYLEQKYCRRAGARLAAKDLGVARQLLPALANGWRII